VWRVEDGVDIVAFVKPAKFERDDDWDCAEAGERLGREDLLGGDEVWSLSIDSSSLIRVSSFSYRFFGTSCAAAVPGTSSKVHSGPSGMFTPAGAWERAWA